LILWSVSMIIADVQLELKEKGEMGEWFQIVTGVRQGCILSPLLFLLEIDWVMKKATCDTASGIEWLNDSKLKDLDFAEDIALLDVSVLGMQDLTYRVEDTAKLVGLHVNAEKNKDDDYGHHNAWQDNSIRQYSRECN